MSDVAHHPLPTVLRGAFEQALAKYRAWRPGAAEPTVSVDRQELRISELCDWTARYSGMMPAAFASLLAREAHAGVDPYLNPDNSYANGARWLRQLILYRGEEFRQIAERRQ
jgi:hypothetical protein